MNYKFALTLWDVGHGLAIWIRTPSGQNHWIDAGKEGAFSPSFHVWLNYGVKTLDYLILSHPDSDHINDLGELVRWFGDPRVLHRNPTLPDEEKFESLCLEYQKVFKDLDTRYFAPVPVQEDPTNPALNGGVEICTGMLTWEEAGRDANNSSIVAMYLYQGWLFVMPGDLDEAGWVKLWAKYGERFAGIIGRAEKRILVAPHHGRVSGYSASMFDCIKPHLTLISDKKAKEPTCASFRDRPSGMQYNPSTKQLRIPPLTLTASSLLRELARDPSNKLTPGMASSILAGAGHRKPGTFLDYLAGDRNKTLVKSSPSFETLKFISTKSQVSAHFVIDVDGECQMHKSN